MPIKKLPEVFTLHLSGITHEDTYHSLKHAQLGLFKKKYDEAVSVGNVDAESIHVLSAINACLLHLESVMVHGGDIEKPQLEILDIMRRTTNNPFATFAAIFEYYNNYKTNILAHRIEQEEISACPYCFQEIRKPQHPTFS